MLDQAAGDGVESLRLWRPRGAAISLGRLDLRDPRAPEVLEHARAEFEATDYPAARRSLELVQEHNPGHVSRTGHLLYARTLEAQGEIGPAAPALPPTIGIP